MLEGSGSVPPHSPAAERNTRPRLARKSLPLAAAIVALAGAGTWWLDAHMRAESARSVVHAPMSSFVGFAAPDFVLPDVRTGRPVRLSDSLGSRPVVLLFGSFSCPRLYNELPAIRRLYEEYGKEVDFRFVYSKEAYHPNPEFEAFCRDRPDGELHGHVLAGLEFYHLDFPCAVANDEVEMQYAPYPARLIVFDRDGDAVFDSESARNPAGLRLAEATRHLKDCLPEHANERARP